MRRVVAYMIFAAVALITLSCERRPLIELDNNRYMFLFDFQKHLINDTIEELPELMHIHFYNATNSDYRTSHFVEQQGGELSIDPGTYHILTYNFNTESTIIKNHTDYQAIEATTNEIPSFLFEQLKQALQTRMKIKEEYFSNTKVQESERIMNEPDYLFHTVLEGERLELYNESQQVVRLNTSSVVERWVVEVNRIGGVEYLADASMIISGVVPSVSLNTREKSEESATLFFNLNLLPGTNTLHGEFNTFGLHPINEEDPQLLTIILTDKKGKQYHHHYRLNKDIFNPDTQKLIILDDIVIEPPQEGGGGFNPEVNEWDEIKTEINI